jgi:maltose alpha-D-glucosyltransferase/alpha-amylase
LPALAVTGVWQSIFEPPAAEALERLLPAYLQTQRWFTGKGGTPTSARLVEHIPFEQGDVWIMLVQVEYAIGEPKRFVLPMAFRKEDAAAPNADAMPPEPFQIARLTLTGGADGETQTGILFDAMADKAFATRLLDAFARHRRFRGGSGQLVARTTAPFHRFRDFITPALEPTLIKAEQNNTSIAFGNGFVLKLLRWVEDGVNPEAEVGQALAQKTTFTAIAPLVGMLNYHAGNGTTTWAILSKYITNEGDAWRYTVEAVRRYFEHVLTRRENRPDPVIPTLPFLDVVQKDIVPQATEWLGTYLEAARLMGRRTAEMHAALGSIADDPAFTPEPFTLEYQRSSFQTIRTWVYRVGQQLRLVSGSLPLQAQADAQVVLGREGDIIQYLRAIMSRRIRAQRIRCHGDYRLGSLLYTGKDFVIIDFEGETLRPMSTRRHKRSPLRDVAGWLHSMYFAVQSVLHSDQIRAEDRPIAEPWARFWQWWIAVAFVKAYLEVAGTEAYLPHTRDETQIVLDYSLLCRGIYELRYHLFNHPERSPIPLRALLHLLHDRDRRQAPPECDGTAQPSDIPAVAPPPVSSGKT